MIYYFYWVVWKDEAPKMQMQDVSLESVEYCLFGYSRTFKYEN